MKYNYPEIQGEFIQIEEFTLARAKSIALASLKNPTYILDPLFIKRSDNAEIILLKLDIEIPQNPQNGIEEQEDIAIICYKEDEYFPEVYALRNDFQLGLPHTNLGLKEYPVSLCITEQIFQEVKHTFNSLDFIESIRRWFSLTSENKLHAHDQPLEPFYVPKGFIIVPNKVNNIDINEFYIEQIAPDFYQIQKERNLNPAYFCLGFQADEQVNGFIRKEPQTIKDLSEILLIKGNCLSTVLTNYLRTNNNALLSNKEVLNKKIAIYCGVPVKRYSDDKVAEKVEELFFVTKKSVKEIGIENEIWSETPDKKDIVQLIGKKFDERFVERIEIETYSTMLDFNRLTAALYNKENPNKEKFTLIGVGALGSQVLSLYARTGYGEWTIIDNDVIFPHNLARHKLGRDSIGLNKVDKLAEELNNLLGEDFCKAINANFLNIYNNDEIISELKKSKAIIDISTSIAVERLLARDYGDEIDTRRITAFLNPNGTDLIILAEDKNRKHRLDFLEMEYYRLIFREQNLHSHLQFHDDLKIRFSRNSCRDISNRINEVNVSLLSSICAKTIRNIVENRDALIGIWSIDPNNYSVQKYATLPTKWEKIYSKDWKIYLNHQLLSEMHYLRYQKLPNETGGVLLGSIDMERNIIYIYDTIYAPEDSHATGDGFERGIKGVLNEYNEYRKITDLQIQYLGEWHSHPAGYSTKPSSLDMKLFKYLSENLSRQGYPTLMGILGDKDFQLVASVETN